MKKYGILLTIAAVLLFPALGHAADLSVSPSQGTFTAGSTFDVQVFMDTEDQSVNAMQVSLDFPPNMLQVVSPSSGESIVGVWTSQPSYNNTTGEITFQGGIPNGINTSNGLIANITFRAVRTGTAVLEFSNDSQVLLHDGQGTDVLNQTNDGVYTIALPPPDGPSVVSETHPRQNEWYPRNSAVLSWGSNEVVEGYSYVLNREPVFEPDNISEGEQTRVSYEELESGTHYFHIKSMRNGIWGGVTHFAINVDVQPPADFPINIIPGVKTSSKSPVVEFQTTDALSGIDHYEFKTVSLNPEGEESGSEQNFFIESQGRHVLNLENGKYDIIARAYDRAGNVREVTERLQIMTPLGVLADNFIGFWPVLLLIVIAGGVWGIRTHKWHLHLDRKHKNSEMPEEVDKKLEKLKKYKDKYGDKLSVLLPFIIMIGAGILFGFGSTVHAQEALSPPVISQVSENISNEDIFYVGGEVENGAADIVVHLRNENTGETSSFTVSPNEEGEWFYRHPTFISDGDYILWAQARMDGQESPPSPQVEMEVSKTAVSIGNSQVSERDLYLALFLLFLAISVVLTVFIGFHLYHGHHKRKDFWEEVSEVEEAIMKGFVSIKRDIERELEEIESQDGSDVGEGRKEELLNDLREVKKHIGKELDDLESLRGKL